MNFSDITTLVFDFDGTLGTCPLDFHQMRRSILTVAADFGLPEDTLADFGLLEAIEEGARLLEGRRPRRPQGTQSARTRGLQFRSAALASLTALEYEAAGRSVLLPGVVEALTRLSTAGYRIGIVTRNSSAVVTRIIGAAPLTFDALLCREDVRRPKPHPEHVLEMLRLLEKTAVEALMVGDHPWDIQVGRAAGMRTAAVLTGQSSAAELAAAAPDIILPSVVELGELLMKKGGEDAHAKKG